MTLAVVAASAFEAKAKQQRKDKRAAIRAERRMIRFKEIFAGISIWSEVAKIQYEPRKPPGKDWRDIKHAVVARFTVRPGTKSTSKTFGFTVPPDVDDQEFEHMLKEKYYEARKYVEDLVAAP